MLFLVLLSLSLGLFVVMGYKSAERLVEGMAIYQVLYLCIFGVRHIMY